MSAREGVEMSARAGEEVRVNFLPEELDRGDGAAVVIDVLRASSTVVAALAAGARKVVPVCRLEEAFALKRADPKVLLGGESGGLKIPGFDLGNSPLEYTPSVVRDREIVLRTTNGTRAALVSKGAQKLVLASFLNLSRVIEFLSPLEGGITVQCAGTDGRFSLEDVLLAGALAARLGRELTGDSALAARLLYENLSGDLATFMEKNCAHGRKLVSLGFVEDVTFCARIDSSDVLPLWRESGFTRGD